ncbi:MAG: hypothetical protein ABI583_09510 [Betaproteobacteria bacterium]
MFTANSNTIKQAAMQRRQEEVSRFMRDAGTALTDWLRQRHEGALRRLPRVVRMRSVNATPV